MGKGGVNAVDSFQLQRIPLGGQRRVGVEQFWLVATPNYLADRKLPIEPGDLNEHDGIFTQPGDSGWNMTHQDGRTARVAPGPRTTSIRSTSKRRSLAKLKAPFGSAGSLTGTPSSSTRTRLTVNRDVRAADVTSP